MLGEFPPLQTTGIITEDCPAYVFTTLPEYAAVFPNADMALFTTTSCPAYTSSTTRSSPEHVYESML